MERLETDLHRGYDTHVYAIDIFTIPIVIFTINADEKSTDKRSSKRSGQSKNQQWTDGVERTVNYVTIQPVKEVNRECADLKTAQGNLSEQHSPSLE